MNSLRKNVRIYPIMTKKRGNNMNNAKYDKVFYPVREISDLKEMITKSAELYGDKAAYLQKDKPGGTFCPVTYNRFKDEMDSFGTRLLDMGLKGKKIAVIGESCYQWILTYFATVSGVGVIVPLDKNLPEEEMRSLIERSGASAIVFTKRYEKSVMKLYDEPGSIEYFISIAAEEHSDRILSMPRLIEEGQELLREGIREYVDADIDPDQLATLMFTSGTTGLAKGVMLSHRNIANNVFQMSKVVKIPEDGVVLSILPIHHAYEFTCSICTTFYQGKTIAICEGIKYIQKNMNEVHTNIMLGVPLVFEKMYKGMWKQAEKRGEAEKLRKAIDLSRKFKLYNNKRLMKKLFKAIHQSFGNNIDLLIAGGAAIDPKVIEDFEAMGLPMIQGYGMSEHAPLIAVNKDRYSKAASVGKPMPGTEVKILNPDEYGVGEIICKGDSVMLGYYENEEATNEVLVDGWLHTGDLGYFDKDGFLYLNGRKKTVIVTKGGKNIYPEEVEAKLMDECDLIKEVLVYGKVDERVGNVIITADIFPDFDKIRNDRGDMTGSEIYHMFKDIIDEINALMPPYKAVKRINIREKEFVKTTTGKIKRYGNGIDSNSGSSEGRGNSDLERTKMFVKSMKESEDPCIRYTEGRPVTDVKHMFETSVELYGDRPAFRLRKSESEPYTEISYREAAADVNGLGTSLVNRIKKEEKAGLLGEASYEWEITYLAVLNGAGVAVPLDKELKKEELVKVLNDADVKCLFYDKKHEKTAKEILSEGNTGVRFIAGFEEEETAENILSWSMMVEEGKQQIGQGDRQYVDNTMDPDKLSVLLYTAGTTGKAKGVMLSHKNLVMDIMAATTIVDVKPEDVFFSILPIHHTYETTCGLLIPLYKGASVAFGRNPEKALDDMAEVKPTVLLAVPSLAEAFYKKIWEKAKATGKEKKLQQLADINHQTKRIGIEINRSVLKELLMEFGTVMKMIVTGGAPLDHEILQFFNDMGVITVQGYGITECGPVAAINPDIPKEMRMDSVGHILPGMDVKIEDKDENGIGEICLKGENVMLGYYNDEEAAKEVLEGGWFHTGDLGFTDKDGFIYITGRKKTVIRTKSGKNVFPEELEYMVNRIPYVADSMVWAEESGEDVTIIATIFLNAEEVKASLGEDVQSEKIEEVIWNAVDGINEELPQYKKIRRIRIREDEFYKNSSQKIKRFVEENK